jgi:bleomycin hydrolase
MKRTLTWMLFCVGLYVQAQSVQPEITLLKKVTCSAVKDQGATGTCWSFSTTSLVESQTLKRIGLEIDLSEMFTVRNIYIEKAKNYVLRQGHAQFGAGGLGHDVIRSISTYGAIPENSYSGLLAGKVAHNHTELDTRLKNYLDSVLTFRPLPKHWLNDYNSILDEYLGKVPDTFFYNERYYTPITFAKDVLRFESTDYVNLTSFLHHPFYSAFILEVPDNFLNGAYYNIPIDELLKVTEQAVSSGYSVMWDADVSNNFFKQDLGLAMQWIDGSPRTVGGTEQTYDPSIRQVLFENLTTQDDHLMHLVGLEKSKTGNTFFLVKNSWGEKGPDKGYIHVSKTYFAINTISLVVPKAALDNSLKLKLGLK